MICNTASQSNDKIENQEEKGAILMRSFSVQSIKYLSTKYPMYGLIHKVCKL